MKDLTFIFDYPSCFNRRPDCWSGNHGCSEDKKSKFAWK